jgi:hypothetical protein
MLMIIILLLLVIATFLVRKHRSESEPSVPLHDQSRADWIGPVHLPFSMPAATLTTF